MSLNLSLEEVDFIIQQLGYHYLQDEDEMDAALMCPICHRPLDAPVRSVGCPPSTSHDFCRTCIAAWCAKQETNGAKGSCPLDRTELKGIQLSPDALLRELNNLVVVCSFGCGWQGPRLQWWVHLMEQCQEVEIGGLRRGASEIERLNFVLERLKKENEKLKSEIEKLQKETRGKDNVHTAICDQCHKAIVGLRFKCLVCPDYDFCQDCHTRREALHPTHPFVRLHSSADIDAIPRPLEYHVRHLYITCDGCARNPLTGPRYRCTVCPDYDLCEGCLSLPVSPHDNNHPMVRFIVSVNG